MMTRRLEQYTQFKEYLHALKNRYFEIAELPLHLQYSYDLLVQSGGFPENVPLAVHILCPSPLVSLYPVSQVYVTGVL